MSRNFPAIISLGCLAVAVLAGATCLPAFAQGSLITPENRLGFEEPAELLADFVSQAPTYAAKGLAGLEERGLVIEPGRFGNCLHIADGWPMSKGTWNESGLDCDLIVAVMWGEWRTKPHFWGAGKFHGNQGTVAFWVKREELHPGIVFMQGSVAWGRKERDLFTVEVDEDGRFSAHIRDIRSRYHRVTADEPTWVDGEWQHIAVAYDRAYGLKLYHNGELVGSTWGEDAWWQTTLPGLFSPFLPEAWYDEIWMVDLVLEDEDVRSLFKENLPINPYTSRLILREYVEPGARERLLAQHGDLSSMDLPTVVAGEAALRIKQTEVAACRDEKIPAWWVMDGRYELAWPHPYRLFTFILGDADFHGEKVDLLLEPGERPNYVAFEGVLDDVALLGGQADSLAQGTQLVRVQDYDPLFYASRIDIGDAEALRVPLVKEYGSPGDLQGSANIPLSGDTRIHEIHLWQVESVPTAAPEGATCWYLMESSFSFWAPRYSPALNKLLPGRDREVVPTALALSETPATHRLGPLQPMHIISPALQGDTAVDAVGLRLLVTPEDTVDHLWLKLRDPANPSRLWAQACVRVEYKEAGSPQPVSLVLDMIDLMLAKEDRLLLEVTSANGCRIMLGDAECPSVLTILPSKDPAGSLEAYAKHEMHACRAQYMKEYNYRPWRFTGEKMSIDSWRVFGGPFDMAYPPLAVLRHDPDNRIANIYKTLLFQRSWFGCDETIEPERELSTEGPEWARWERAVYAKSREVTDWIVGQQRPDGNFWGGPNDDSFFPLGWAAMPLLGDEPTRKSWLRFYDGLEEQGIFHDGYCDIWPIDPLHITDYITSRGLMLSFALGDPGVFERELRTTERYHERVSATNAKRAQEGLPLLSGRSDMRNKEGGATLIEQMEAEILNYSRTHVEWYWGVTPKPAPYELANRDGLVQALKQAALEVDEVAVFGFTEARVHTDNQRGIGRDYLIAAALGGRVQGRAEAYPNAIAVSWEDVQTEDLARLVTYADDERLAVNLYNFGETPIETTMRVWGLGKGVYDVTMGPDEDDDGAIDAGAPPLLSERRELARFSTVALTVPPGQNVAVTVEQTEALPQAELLPDLAVSRLTYGEFGALVATVHNIGVAPARDVRVDLRNASGEVLATRTIEEIGTPAAAAYAAQRARVVFADVPTLDEYTIIVDPENAIEEIFEENNIARLE